MAKNRRPISTAAHPFPSEEPALAIGLEWGVAEVPPACAPRYDVLPSVALVRSWVSPLPEKTGRSLAEWLTCIQAAGPPTEADRRDWLRTTLMRGTNAAWWRAERAPGTGAESDGPDTYLAQAAAWVEAMDAARRAALRPIFDELCRIGRTLGDDGRVCPCSAIVPLFRNHVIAQIKPTTNTRLDLGLALGATAATGRSRTRP